MRWGLSLQASHLHGGVLQRLPPVSTQPSVGKGQKTMTTVERFPRLVVEAKGKGGGGGGKGQGRTGKGASGSGGGGAQSSKNPMTPEEAARIQSAEARAHGGRVEKGSFASRAQRAAARNAPVNEDDDFDDDD